MGLNSQAKQIGSGRSSYKSFLKEGIKFKMMSGDEPILFRILPAFGPTPDIPYVPFVMPNRDLTDWARVVYVSRNVGHGSKGFGVRKDLVSLQSFTDDEPKTVFCPLESLAATIRQNAADWEYLTKGLGTKESVAFKRPGRQMLANIVDINKPEFGAQIGVFSHSACGALLNTEDGLVFQRNNLPEEILRQNYLLGYAVGDMTDPINGPVLLLTKGKEKAQGDFTPFKVVLAIDNAGRLMTRPIDAAWMANRQPMTLANLPNLIERPTEAELVADLIMLLNGRSPKGYHEYSLLKLAFPQFPIPDAPMAPAAMPTVPSGFGQSAAASTPMPPAQGMTGEMSATMANAQAAGHMLPPAPYTPPAAMPPVAAPQAPVMPPAAPPAYTQPVAAPQAPQAAPAAPTATSGVTGSPVAPGPVVPGDVPYGQFDREAFMRQLKQQAK